MKIHPVGAELFHMTDGRTDMTKLNRLAKLRTRLKIG